MSTVSGVDTMQHPVGYWAESADKVAERVMDTVMPAELSRRSDCASDCRLVGHFFREFLEAVTTGTPIYSRAYQLGLEVVTSCYAERLIDAGVVHPEENPEDEVCVLANHFAGLVDTNFSFDDMSEADIEKTMRLGFFLRRMSIIERDEWFGPFSLKARIARLRYN